jgi:hypothetical protein
MVSLHIRELPMYLFGPWHEPFGDSALFSRRPTQQRHIPSQLPHITIQCPVYNESLADVIIPTVESLKVGRPFSSQNSYWTPDLNNAFQERLPS